MNGIARPYYVVSPEYETHYSCYEPPEPPEFGADCVEVEATTKRQAIIEGVKKLLGSGRSNNWPRTNIADGQPPWAGMRAKLAVCPHGHPHFVIVRDRPVYQRSCPACMSEVRDGD